MKRTKREGLMNKVVSIRMSELLHQQVKLAAKISGNTIIDYIRMRLVCPQIRPQDKSRVLMAGRIAEQTRELRRQGGLLKHAINMLSENPNSEIIMQDIKNAANGYEKLYEDIAKIYKDI